MTLLRRLSAAARSIVDLVALGIIDARLARRANARSRYDAVDAYLRELDRDTDEGDQ